MSTKPINIRIDPTTDGKLDEASRLSGLPKADIMRFALSVGLRDLELIGYDITTAIHNQVNAAKQPAPDAVGKLVTAIGFHQSESHSKTVPRNHSISKPNLKKTSRA